MVLRAEGVSDIYSVPATAAVFSVSYRNTITVVAARRTPFATASRLKLVTAVNVALGLQRSCIESALESGWCCGRQ